jgi:general secretion pathway protein A
MSMYTAYFGLTEDPFQVTPDPRFFYANSVYQEAYASLQYGISERKGFVVLVGDAGTGKTALLHRLMQQLDVKVRFVYIAHPILHFDDLLGYLCKELDLKVQGLERVGQIRALRSFLLEQAHTGGNVVLLVDEAQNLSTEILEHLRLLSNFETPTQKLLQIVLVGQPELLTKLDQPELQQLKQRISIQRQLGRLKSREVGLYIQERLHTVGYHGHGPFPRDSVERIALYAQGVPRLINVICDNALLTAYGLDRRVVDGPVIEEVALDLQLKIPNGRKTSPMALLDTRGEDEDQGAFSDEETFARRVAPQRRPRRRLGVIVALLLFAVVAGGGAVMFPADMWDRVIRVGQTVEMWRDGIWARIALVVSGPPADSKVDTTAAPLAQGEPDEQDRGPREAPAPTPAVGSGAEAQPPGQVQGKEAESPASPSASPEVTPALASGVSSGPRGLAKASQEELVATEPTAVGRPAQPGENWKEEPYIIPPGATVAEIVTTMYGNEPGKRFLALDLIKEANAHIENLSRIRAGQKLWLPPVSRQTLLRAQPDDTLNLVLGAYRSAQEAEGLAREVQQAGYHVRLKAANVATSLVLYRVEIVALPSLEAAKQAWAGARAHHWFPFSDGLAW